MGLKEEVTKTVLDWAAAGKQFTAFDVTSEMRAAHPGEPIYHNDVKSLVHAMWLGGEFPPNYARTLVPLGSGEQPFMYHDAALPPQVAQPQAAAQPGGVLQAIVNGLQFWKGGK